MPRRPRSKHTLRPGDVVRMWDRETIPEKQKRHICICPDQQLFLRINSKAVFQPAFQLRHEDCDFIEHDSWVELTHLHRAHGPDIRNAEPLGRLSETVALELLRAVDLARTLTPEQKGLVRARLASADGPITP